MATVTVDVPGTAVSLSGGFLIGWDSLSLAVGDYTVERVASTLFSSKVIALSGDYTGGWPSDLGYNDDADSVSSDTTFTSVSYSADTGQTTFAYSSLSPYTLGGNPNARFTADIPNPINFSGEGTISTSFGTDIGILSNSIITQ